MKTVDFSETIAASDLKGGYHLVVDADYKTNWVYEGM